MNINIASFVLLLVLGSWPLLSFATAPAYQPRLINSSIERLRQLSDLGAKKHVSYSEEEVYLPLQLFDDLQKSNLPTFSENHVAEALRAGGILTARGIEVITDVVLGQDPRLNPTDSRWDIYDGLMALSHGLDSTSAWQPLHMLAMLKRIELEDNRPEVVKATQDALSSIASALVLVRLRAYASHSKSMATNALRNIEFIGNALAASALRAVLLQNELDAEAMQTLARLAYDKNPTGFTNSCAFILGAL